MEGGEVQGGIFGLRFRIMRFSCVEMDGYDMIYLKYIIGCGVIL